MMRYLLLIPLSALLLAVHPGPAQAASDLDFGCQTNCVELTARNDAAVVVTKLNVTQRSSDVCQKVEKTYKPNMAVGEKAVISGSANCAYKFRFVTTSSCPGKDGTAKPEDYANDKRTIALEGTCMKLTVHVIKQK